MSSPAFNRTPKARAAHPPFDEQWARGCERLSALSPSTCGGFIGQPKSYIALDDIENEIARLEQLKIAAAAPEISPLTQQALDEVNGLERRYQTALAEHRALITRLRQRVGSEREVSAILGDLPTSWQDEFPQLPERGSKYPRFANFSEARAAVERLAPLVSSIEGRCAQLRASAAVTTESLPQVNRRLILRLSQRLAEAEEQLRSLTQRKRKS